MITNYTFIELFVINHAVGMVNTGRINTALITIKKSSNGIIQIGYRLRSAGHRIFVPGRIIRVTGDKITIRACHSGGVLV